MKVIAVIVGILLGMLTYVILTSFVMVMPDDIILSNFQVTWVMLNFLGAFGIGLMVSYRVILWFKRHTY